MGTRFSFRRPPPTEPPTELQTDEFLKRLNDYPPPPPDPTSEMTKAKQKLLRSSGPASDNNATSSDAIGVLFDMIAATLITAGAIYLFAGSVWEFWWVYLSIWIFCFFFCAATRAGAIS